MNMQKRAKRFLKGLTISWTDVKPLEPSDQISNQKVTHKIPTLRHCANDIYMTAPDWIHGKAILHWKVTAVLIFKYDNGVDQHEEREFKYHGALKNINEVFCDEVKKAMNYGENYSHTEITVECVGY